MEHEVKDYNQPFSDIASVHQWLEKSLAQHIQVGLERVKWLDERLGRPHLRLKFVHIAGTNGKGSTAAFLRSILIHGGYEVGMFTSPPFLSYNHGITWNLEPISDQAIIACANRLYPLVEEMASLKIGKPSAFEITTMIAMLYFATMRYPDLVIWETGMGGRDDATNFVIPIITAITNIGQDHQEFLGSSLLEIAEHKLGIMKAGVPLITCETNQEIIQLFRDKAVRKRTSLYLLEEQFYSETSEIEANQQIFSVKTPFSYYNQLSIQLYGMHQQKNATLAVMIADYLKQYMAFLLSEEVIRLGLASTQWQGRMQTLRENPRIIVDGAHNVEGIKALVKAIQLHFSEQNITIIFGVLKEKKICDMLDDLHTIAEKIFIVNVNHFRAFNADQLMSEYTAKRDDHKLELLSDWKNYIDVWQRQNRHSDQILLITGSLFLVNEVINEWRQSQ